MISTYVAFFHGMFALSFPKPHQAQTGDWLFHIKYPFKQQNSFGPREDLIYAFGVNYDAFP